MANSQLLVTLALTGCLLMAAQGINFHSWDEFSHGGSTGYDAEKLNIHILSHTHDDMGWLKTVDQYYYGDRNDIQHAGVQYILDTTVRALADNPERRFVYVEMGFFKRWWDEQNDTIKDMVRGLIKNGQLEFANAGWTMNDESDIYYADILNNMALGHEFMLKEFGIRPRVAWHIDPFGHQASQAALFAEMGFDAFFFSRIDYQDRNKRIANKTMEMIWRPETPAGKQSEIFTNVMYDNYCTPPGFCFDQGCDDTPMRTDPHLEGFNAEQRAADFLKIAKERAQAYPTNNVMITMGCDFQFENAFENFKNIDALIFYVRKLYGDQVNIFYSTPQTYVDYVHKTGYNFTVKTDDFEPYADRVNGYWSGYYTSRVAQKGYISDISKFYSAGHTLATMHLFGQLSKNSLATEVYGYNAQAASDVDNILTSYRALYEALSLNTHHDAVSGTEKQHVADDYMKRLYRGEVEADSYMTQLLSKRQMALTGALPLYQRCNLNRTSTECDALTSFSTENSLKLTVFNPSRDSTHVIRAKVPSSNVKVADADGKEIASDIFCEKTEVIDTETAGEIVDDCNLYMVDSMKPHEIKDYFLTQSAPSDQIVGGDDTEGSITNSLYTLKFDQTSGEFQTLTVCDVASSNACEDTPFSIDFRHYLSMQDSDQNSGAYIFRPNDATINATLPYKGALKSSQVFKGAAVEQVTFDYENIKLKARLFKDSDLPVELEILVKSIDITDGTGREIIVQYSSDIKNDKTFYTDSCGLYMQKRVVDFRPTWDLEVNQPRAGNYFPIRNAIFIQEKDAQKRLTVSTDRSQGAAAIDDGNVEVMVHRRLTQDDARGVAEPLNESAYNRGLQTIFTHYISIENLNLGESNSQRVIQRRLDQQPLVYYSVVTQTEVSSHMMADTVAPESPLAALMDGVDAAVKVEFRVMDHATYGQGYVIIFTNLSESNSACDFSKVTGATRLTLSYNEDWDSMMSAKYQWASNEEVAAEINTAGAITLQGLEIRAYFVPLASV